MSVDSTGRFSSTRVSCPHCRVKQTKQGPAYYHQLLAGAIVHPNWRTVLPLDCEPIAHTDGATKNDCEQSACSRAWPPNTPQRHFVVLEDALAANGPHLQTLAHYGMDFIIVAKAGSNAALFEALHARRQQGQCTEWETRDAADGTTRGYRLTMDVGLNHTHPELRVNVLEYWETGAKGKRRHWRWITNLERCRDNAGALMRTGRTRWKIENETFNTLKNQGYHFEHNFGHGQQYLSSTLAGLMLLAF